MWDFVNSELFKTILGVTMPFISAIIIVVCRLIASRVKNEKLRRLISVLPEAMITAERNGGSSTDKLNFAVSFVKEKIKGLSTAIIKDFIENAISISKNVNADKKYSIYSRGS